MSIRNRNTGPGHQKLPKIAAGAVAAAIAGCLIPVAAIYAEDSDGMNVADESGQTAQSVISIIASGNFPDNTDAHWFLSETGVLSITGNGPIAYDYALKQHANEITSIFIGKEITSIATDTFSLLPELKDVSFEENSKLEELGICAFYSCQSLETVYLPPSIKEIKAGAFSTCYLLKEIDFGGQNSKLANLGASAFNNCESLSSITLPNQLKTIGNYTFIGCTSLQNVTIPASVESIAQGAFEDCTSLKQVTIENKRGTEVQPGAFNNTPFADLQSAEGEKSESQIIATKANLNTRSIAIKSLKTLGKGKLRVTWKQVPAAKSYTINYKKRGSKHFKKLVIKGSAKRRAVIKGLKKGCKYRVRISANKKKNGKGTICTSAMKTSKRIK